jgi:tRNA(Ile)-lysidine synthase
MIKHLDILKNRKNLLAFSAGGDSTALFFLLLEHKISFDIAIVNYNLREQSKDEIEYAKNLATKYNLKIFIKDVTKIDSNFEANARAIRYDFFNQIIDRYNYDNLLTAHHLADRFEWFLMQFCKGSGCVELAGMKEIEHRKNYTLIRPLLEYDKSELLEYLKSKNIKYFEDETNKDEKYKRNYFRHNFSNPLLKKYKDGIKRSFEYIQEDKDELVKDIEILNIDDFYYFKSSKSIRSNIYNIDKTLKNIGYMLTKNERQLLKTSKTLVVGRVYVVSFYKEYIFIAPYLKDITLTKEFKERCRVLKIDPKLRGYLFKNKILNYIKI